MLRPLLVAFLFGASAVAGAQALTFAESCGGRNCPSTGADTWRVQDNGTLCVTIKWPTLSEDWCRYVFTAGDKYYAVGKHEDNAPANEFEFSK